MTSAWRFVAAAVLLVVVTAALLHSDFAFYNPRRGLCSAGKDAPLQQAHEREILTITINEGYVRRFHRAPTLAQIATFYGVSDSLRCSVRQTFHSDEKTAAERPLPPQTEVKLCLD